MNAQNTRPACSFHKTPLATESIREKAKVLGTALADSANLTIADDSGNGCDPYNSTGQHVILQAKRRQ
jgi:hypothetical protein